jgi:RsiW-degrading membrane proteinase PrsW (M82 family)
MDGGSMNSRGASLPRRSIWIVQLVTFVGLIAYVALVRLLVPILEAHQRPAPAAVGVVLTLVPTLLWLALFYVQDAREPEPLTHVLRVNAAGGVLAAAIAVPILRPVLAAGDWLYAGTLIRLLVSICVIGALQGFCVYLAVRFTVLEIGEFDETADGVTYGTAAGLGVATVFNLWFVLDSPSINPVPAALRIVVVALGHAAFGGLIGYFLGRAKLLHEHGAVVWGFLGAAVLNGAVTVLLQEVTQVGLSYRPWNGLAAASAVATAVTLLLFWLARRASGAPARRAQAAAHMMFGNNTWRQTDLPVWAVFVLLLAVGWVIVTHADARTTAFVDPQGPLRLHYPAGWLASPGSSRLLDVQDPLSGAPLPPRFMVTREKHAAEQSLAYAASETILVRSQQLALYRALATRPVRVAGQNAITIEYAFVEDPHADLLGAERVPIVIRGVEAVFLFGRTAYHLDVRVPAGAHRAASPMLDRILRSVQLQELTPP